MNILAVAKGHYLVAKEHIENHSIKHTVTWLQVFRVMVTDFIKHKTITIGRSYIIYNVINKPTLGIKVVDIVSIYVPKEDRGKGVASKLLDAVPYRPIIGDSSEAKYRSIGNTKVIREII